MLAAVPRLFRSLAKQGPSTRGAAARSGRNLIPALWLLFAAIPSAWASISISTAATAGPYKAGQAIALTVTLGAAVDITGGPPTSLTLALNAGNATCTTPGSLSGVTSLSCSYTVSGADSGSLALSGSPMIATVGGGTIVDAGTMTTSTFTAGTFTAGVLLDNVAPTLSGAGILVNNSVRPNTIQLTFSEEMSQTGLTTPSKYAVTNNSGTVTYSIASVSATSAGTSPTVVTLTLSAADPANTATYITNADAAAFVRVTPSATLTDVAGNAIAGTTITASAAPTTDNTVPTLPATKLRANNSVQPNVVTLTFSEPLLNNGNITDVNKYTLTNNGGTVTYKLASATQSSPGVVTLTLSPTDQATATTYITSADINAHLKVALSSGFSDLAGNALAAATITEAGANPAPVLDTTPPTLSGTLTIVDNTHLRLTFSERMNKTTAETVTNYTLSSSTGVTGFTGNPASALLSANGTDLILTIPALPGLKTSDVLTVTASTGIQDLSGLALASTATASLTVSIIPASFTFAAVVRAPIKTATQSNAVTFSGLNAPASVTLAAGSDSSLLCSLAPASTGIFGNFVACTTLAVNSGDQLKLQLTSSATASTTVSGGIVIGGVSGVFSVTTSGPATILGSVSFSALTSLTGTLTNPDPAVYISSNGVLVVPKTNVLPVSFTAAAPPNTAVLLSDGGTYSVNTPSISLSAVPATGNDALFVTKAYSVDGVPNTQLLELAAGRATIAYSGPGSPVMSLQLGTGSSAKQVLISAPLVGLARTASVTLDVQRNSDGTMTVAVVSGAANLRLASSGSTVIATDLAAPLYRNEVATINAAGKISAIRIGSFDGKGGVVGDALPSGSTISVASSRAKIPNLGLPLDRIDSGKPLLQTLFDFIGSRTTLSANIQGNFGQLPLLLDNAPLYVIPYGDVLVDTTRPDGITLANDGHFEVSRSGVYVKLTTCVSNLISFASAVHNAFNGTVTITEDGAYELNNGGRTMLTKPNLVSSHTGGNLTGLNQTASGLVTFETPGTSQVLFPHFYDLTQLAATFAALDPKMVLLDNLDGTVTAKLNGTPYILSPLYEVLSPIGGIPPEHRSDPWWMTADGTIYFKYPTGAAQGFKIH